MLSFAVIRCGPLSPPINGGGRCSDEDNYGSICLFRCNLGYRLVGPSERLCQDTKQWTGEEAECVGTIGSLFILNFAIPKQPEILSQQCTI